VANEQPGALEALDDELRRWIAAAVDEEVEVSLVAPGTPSEKSPAAGSVRAYLTALEPAPANAAERNAPLEFRVKYLITVSADNPRREHRLLGQLVTDALEHRHGELDLTGPSEATWRAFGVAPRPAFFLRLPVRIERPARDLHRVTQPPIVRSGRARPLVGRVLGPEEVPVAGALIEYEPLHATARSDPRGWFRFPSVLSSDAAQEITIRARGESRSFPFNTEPMRGEPMVFRMTFGGV
jgi:hypothetical protein